MQSASHNKDIKIVPIAIVLLAGGFLAILNQTLLTTAIPHIMSDLSLTENTAQWVTTIFMLVNGVMIPVTAFLTETFTTRRLFMSAMGLFAVGTVFCAFTTNFPLLIVGRIVQAAGAGIIMPLMMTIFLLVFPIHKRGTAMGLVGLVISFAPAIGPTLSGWIIDQYPWKTIFFIILPFIIIDMIAAYFVLENVTERTFPKVDVLSIILSSFGFGGLLFGFSSAGNFGWSNLYVVLALAIGALALVVFILRQLKLKQPMLEFRIFKYKIFTLTTAIGMIAFIVLIGAETLLPIYMQNMAGFSALDSGLMIMPGAIVMGIMSPINGRIFDKIGGRWLMITGLGIVVITSFAFTNLTVDTSMKFLTIMFAIRMFGISMIMMPSATTGLNQLPNKLIAHGTAMNNTMRQVGASIGTAMLITIMTSTALNGEATITDKIQGVNMAFYVTIAFAIIGLIMAFYVPSLQKLNEKRQISQK